MTEETFFSALRDHLEHYTLRITYHTRSPLTPYAVEIFFGKESARAAGFTTSECFEAILSSMQIVPRAALTTSPGTGKTL